MFHILQGDAGARAAQHADRASDRATQVIRVGALLVAAARRPPAHAQAVAAARRSMRGSPGEVYATALAFMAPRTLEPVPVSQLTLWGLRGLTALDPRPERRGCATASCASPDLRRSAPACAGRRRRTSDIDGWGGAAASLAAAAAGASPPVRRAGHQGVVQSFFDELFNHLDPYSRYVPPRDAGEDRERRARARPAPGCVSSRRGAAIVVAEADRRTARAPIAGIRPGDTILAVDGQSTQGKDARDRRGLDRRAGGHAGHDHLARPR